MKSLVTTDQGKAIELLRQAPQLSYAIFQALLLMGLVSTDSLASVVDAAGAPPQAAATAPTQAIPPPRGNTPPLQARDMRHKVDTQPRGKWALHPLMEYHTHHRHSKATNNSHLQQQLDSQMPML